MTLEVRRESGRLHVNWHHAMSRKYVAILKSKVYIMPISPCSSGAEFGLLRNTLELPLSESFTPRAGPSPISVPRFDIPIPQRISKGFYSASAAAKSVKLSIELGQARQ